METEELREPNSAPLHKLAWINTKIAGAAALEALSYIGWASGPQSRFVEDSRLQRLLAERRELKSK